MAALFFTCICTHCRRHAEIEIKKLGRSVTCRQCGKSFVARDPDGQSAALDDPLKYWIQFTDHGYRAEEFDTWPSPEITRRPR